MSKIVIKRHPWIQPTPEMIDWMLKKDKSLKNKEIEIHHPVLVECVETLKPDDFRIFEFDGNEYAVIESANDVIPILPSDIELLKNSFIKIPDLL